MKTYTVVLFKRHSDGEVYGAKTFEGNLDRSCKRLIKLFGLTATVRSLGFGRYDIAGGQAELRVRR